MKMKNGDKFFFMTTFFLIGCLLAKNNVKKDKQRENPTLSQYLNRLKEFFDQEKIDEVEDQFLNLVDFGINPNAAFDSIIWNGDLN